MSVICIICSDSLTPNSEIYATKCGHLFHYKCLVEWLGRSHTCPQCRNETSQQTIHRIYLNFGDVDMLGDDLPTLQNKVDKLQLQVKIKDKALNSFTDKYKKVKIKNTSLKLDLTQAENELTLYRDRYKNMKRHYVKVQKEVAQCLKEVKTLADKYKSASNHNSILRHELEKVRKEVKIQDRIAVYKSKSKEREKLNEKIAKIKYRLKYVEKISNNKRH